MYVAEATPLSYSHVEAMIATIDIDEDLLAQAAKLLGTTDRTALVSAALQALFERESVRRLAKLGGTQPQLKATPRRR
jgi:Arc/MetJ family transcription regulator